MQLFLLVILNISNAQLVLNYFDLYYHLNRPAMSQDLAENQDTRELD